MKQILIVAFVFALGILMLLAEKSPQLEERRVPALNDDAYHELGNILQVCVIALTGKKISVQCSRAQRSYLIFERKCV